jgi:hypothetical protein
MEGGRSLCPREEERIWTTAECRNETELYGKSRTRVIYTEVLTCAIGIE